MSDPAGKITVDIDADQIASLMDGGTTLVRLTDGPVEVYARCEDSLQFEVLADE